MANYPGVPAHQFMPSGVWQANPWDANPPLGTYANIVWPQNQNPFQHQGGAAPWPYNNLQSLYPQYMMDAQGPPNHQPASTSRPARESSYSNTSSDASSLNSSTAYSRTNRTNNSNTSRGADKSTCPCCGNLTIQPVVHQGLYKDASSYLPSSVSDNTLARMDSSTKGAGNKTNNNVQATDYYMTHPYMVQYFQQMKAYQETLLAMMNQQNPTNQTQGHFTANHRKETAGNHIAQGGNRADNYHITARKPPDAEGHNAVMEAYQQSVEQMRSVQDMIQQAYGFNQQPTSRHPADDAKYNSTATSASSKDGGDNSYSTYFK